MNNLGCLLVLIIVSRICHSGPILDEGKRFQRRAPADDDEEEDDKQPPPRNSSAPSSGLLEIPDDDGEEDDDEPTTPRPRPRTTTRAPRTAKPTATAALDFPAPASKKAGARIVFQPLGQVAFNALTRGFTSAFVPLVKNEQPVGIQYGSIPVDMPWGNDDAGDNRRPSGSDATGAATGVVSGFMKTLWGR
ncbi:hypothetical protein WDU94_013153 [Cyamophila willieti]